MHTVAMLLLSGAVLLGQNPQQKVDQSDLPPLQLQTNEQDSPDTQPDAAETADEPTPPLEEVEISPPPEAGSKPFAREPATGKPVAAFWFILPSGV